MAIDPSIALQVKPVELPDPLQKYGQMMTLRAHAAQADLMGLQQQQLRQTIANNAGVQAVLGDQGNYRKNPITGEQEFTDDAAIKLRGIDYNAWDKITTAQTTKNKEFAILDRERKDAAFKEYQLNEKKADAGIAAANGLLEVFYQTLQDNGGDPRHPQANPDAFQKAEAAAEAARPAVRARLIQDKLIDPNAPEHPFKFNDYYQMAMSKEKIADTLKHNFTTQTNGAKLGYDDNGAFWVYPGDNTIHYIGRPGAPGAAPAPGAATPSGTTPAPGAESAPVAAPGAATPSGTSPAPAGGYVKQAPEYGPLVAGQTKEGNPRFASIERHSGRIQTGGEELVPRPAAGAFSAPRASLELDLKELNFAFDAVKELKDQKGASQRFTAEDKEEGIGKRLAAWAERKLTPTEALSFDAIANRLAIAVASAQSGGRSQVSDAKIREVKKMIPLQQDPPAVRNYKWRQLENIRDGIRDQLEQQPEGVRVYPKDYVYPTIPLENEVGKTRAPAAGGYATGKGSVGTGAPGVYDPASGRFVPVPATPASPAAPAPQSAAPEEHTLDHFPKGSLVEGMETPFTAPGGGETQYWTLENGKPKRLR